MRSPSHAPAASNSGRSAVVAFGWLFSKEWRELLASRAWWVMLLVIGPLVGLSFISAVTVYGELSGADGAGAGVGEAFVPLVGVLAPTFSACELAAVFLFPFVIIRLVGGDRQSGALKLEMQHPLPALARIGAKAAVLMLAWMLATLAPLLAVVLWRSYGGAIHAPELLSVVLGHFLNAGLTVAVAAAMAALADHPSTAAILTLSITVGTWIVDFLAAVHGGLWQRLAGYVPAAMVADFQHALVRLDQVLACSAVITGGLMIAAIWIRVGVQVRRRVIESAAAALLMIGIVGASSRVHASWDVSENRMNSFRRADEAALRRVPDRLRIEVHLAPEDPRRLDLERGVIARLTRVRPGTRVRYLSETSTGLFEQTRVHYGEIWYELDGRRLMTRAATVEGSLETIYTLTGVTPAQTAEAEFRGHPLAVTPEGAGTAFFVAWPGAVMAWMLLVRRRQW